MVTSYSSIPAAQILSECLLCAKSGSETELTFREKIIVVYVHCKIGISIILLVIFFFYRDISAYYIVKYCVWLASIFYFWLFCDNDFLYYPFP